MAVAVAQPIDEGQAAFIVERVRPAWREARKEECTITRLHAPEAWRQTAATMLQQRPRTILVIGGGAAGKTSYCRFLIAQLLGAGERPAIVDRMSVISFAAYFAQAQRFELKLDKLIFERSLLSKPRLSP